MSTKKEKRCSNTTNHVERRRDKTRQRIPTAFKTWTVVTLGRETVLAFQTPVQRIKKQTTMVISSAISLFGHLAWACMHEIACCNDEKMRGMDKQQQATGR